MTRSAPASDGKGILHPEGMRAARDLAAGVVHEVNNILGVIIGNAHLAKKHAANAEASQRYLAELRDAAEQGRELMRQLAVLAGEDRLRPRALSLNDLVASAAEGVDAKVAFDLSSEDPIVELDLWLAQAALAALIEFMDGTSSVKSIRIATRAVGGAVALTIEDDGGLLTDRELQTLFAPFAKAERRPRAGVGLAKVADLAARSGGHVAASKVDPCGLRVVLTLPLTRGPASGDGPGVPAAKQRV